MKKFLIAVFSIVSLLVLSETKVSATGYDGALGYTYSSTSGTVFNYYTDKEDVTVSVEINTATNGDVTKLLEKFSGSDGYIALATEARPGDTFRYKICSVSNPGDCEYVLDPFSPYLSVDGTKNVILDTIDIDANWGTISSVSTDDYKRSIYALDVDEFVKHIDAPVSGEKLTYSVFDKMIVSSLTGGSSVGIDYLRSLKFSHIEMTGLYSENNYFAINGEYSNKVDAYSSLNEYQAMILEYKKYDMNVVLKTNFTSVSENLKNSLLSISSTAVIDDKLNYNDPIVQRYIKEVYKFWAREYHVDGFYIEDSSFYGNTFLKSLINELRTINASLFIYSKSDASLYKTSDKLQKLLLGSLTELDNKGIINGKYSKAELESLVEAMFSGYYDSRKGYENANKTINNFGSLEGLDVYSKVKATLGLASNDAIVLNRIRLAFATLYASSGTPRVVSGNEFLNTTLVDGTIVSDDRVCITSTICYATNDNKDLNWDSLDRNGNIVKLFVNYRNAYYYQYPSLYTMKNAKTIKVNDNLLSKGVIFITFDYEERSDGDIAESLFIINYSSDKITLDKISEKDYTSVSAIIGKVSEEDSKTVLAGETFYVFTDVKRVNIPQWVYILLGLALIGGVIGFRQLMIHLLKKKKGINYDEFKNANKGKGFFRRKKKEEIVKESSVFEIFLSDDPLIKERKELAKKAKEERKAKKEAEKAKKEAEKNNIEENKENENDGN